MNTTCTLRVTATDPDTVRVSVRRQQFLVGRPIEFDSEAPRIAALEYALGALGAELVSGLRVFAARRRVEIDQVEATVTGEVARALAYLEVVGESGPPTLDRIQLKVFASSQDEPAVRRLWEELIERLPLVCTVRTVLPLDLELIVTP